MGSLCGSGRVLRHSRRGCAYRKLDPAWRSCPGVVVERAMFAFLTKLLLIMRSRLLSLLKTRKRPKV